MANIFVTGIEEYMKQLKIIERKRQELDDELEKLWTIASKMRPCVELKIAPEESEAE